MIDALKAKRPAGTAGRKEDRFVSAYGLSVYDAESF
jgi:hypothetical protein